MALDRYRRRQAGEQVPEQARQAQSGSRPRNDPSSEIALDDVEEA